MKKTSMARLISTWRTRPPTPTWSSKPMRLEKSPRKNPCVQPQPQRRRRANPTFLKDFSASARKRRRHQHLRRCGARQLADKTLIEPDANQPQTLRLMIATPFPTYDRQGETHFRPLVPQDRQQTHHQRRETGAPRGAPRKRTPGRI